MSLEKAIEHGKEHRKLYYRPGHKLGSCDLCSRMRRHTSSVRLLAADEQIGEFFLEVEKPIEDLEEWANRMAWGRLMEG